MGTNGLPDTYIHPQLLCFGCIRISGKRVPMLQLLHTYSESIHINNNIPHVRPEFFMELIFKTLKNPLI